MGVIDDVEFIERYRYVYEDHWCELNELQQKNNELWSQKKHICNG